jgi:prevent-host-death family protein
MERGDMTVATIRSSADLRNNYNEMVRICREYREPVFITKNGQGDSVLLSIEQYNHLAGRQELYRLLDEGMEDVKNGNVRPYREAMSDIRKKIAEQ